MLMDYQKIFFKTLVSSLVLYKGLFAIENYGAYITPMCYTKTEQNGRITNPCYACHTNGEEPNYFNELALQQEYLFPKQMMQNPYTNLFKDREAEIEKISDSFILNYISLSNYNKALQEKYNCFFHFDAEGFDRDPKGKFTLWRAFVYKPFVGTFFPTNGSIDDVILRLPEIFAQDEKGQFSIDVYKANLQTLLHNIQNSQSNTKRYIGRASTMRVDAGLYPVGTEFLHSVRYIDFHAGKAEGSKRFKELRYGKKERYLSYSELELLADDEALEEVDAEGLPAMQSYLKDPFGGFYNALGWRFLGYIEDQKGNLRLQNQEEALSCIGCHAKLGATTDSTFAFKRHLRWGYQDLYGIDDADGEYKKYLEQNPSGNEYGSNDEVLEKFFYKGGEKKTEAFKKLSEDITILVIPSYKRAMQLNKAYYLIVKEQSFIYAKEVVIRAMHNVYKKIEERDTKIKEIISSEKRN